jgi:beta-lactamase class A
MRPEPPARPVHAGRLPRWERLVFAVVFALMVVFVVIIAMSAAHARGHPASSAGGAGRRLSGAGHRPAQAGLGTGKARAGSGGAVTRAVWDQRLATALRPVLRHQTGSIAVGVFDRTTGAMATFRGGLHFHTASIVKADILATLLLQSQHSGAPLSGSDQALATQMIEASNDAAASSLWNAAGTTDGVAAANVTLGLRRTTPGEGGYWGLTSTTVRDQLTLLRDLTTAKSPLNSQSQAYELGLMRDVDAGQRWGVSAAASPGTTFAIKNGWLPDPQLWVINSIGVLDHGGQRLLMAVLSDHQPSEAAGIAQDQAVAIAAADCITSGR